MHLTCVAGFLQGCWGKLSQYNIELEHSVHEKIHMKESIINNVCQTVYCNYIHAHPIHYYRFIGRPLGASLACHTCPFGCPSLIHSCARPVSGWDARDLLNELSSVDNWHALKEADWIQVFHAGLVNALVYSKRGASEGFNGQMQCLRERSVNW